eukprot:3936674-Rhodomonas_salina.2
MAGRQYITRAWAGWPGTRVPGYPGRGRNSRNSYWGNRGYSAPGYHPGYRIPSGDDEHPYPGRKGLPTRVPVSRAPGYPGIRALQEA